MKTIKLIASDLDGTLLQHGAQKLDPKDIPYIQKVIDEGFLFAAASGREYTNLKRLFKDVKRDMAYLCLNGCLEVYKEKVIYKANMDEDVAHRLVEDIYGLPDAEVLVSSTFTAYTKPKSEAFVSHMQKGVKIDMEIVDDFTTFVEAPSKISACTPHTLEHYQYLYEKYHNDITVQLGGTTWIDCAPNGIHKGVGMLALCEYFGVGLDEVVMFGDNDNDKEVLRAVGFPVAMANAKESILEICPYITDSVKDALERILNNEPLVANPYYKKTIG